MPDKIDYRLKLKVNGTPFQDRDMDDIVELVVDSDYFLPTMFSVTLRDFQDEHSHNLAYADSEKFKIGAAVEISMSAEVETGLTEAVLVKGEITSIEPVFGEDGNSFFRAVGYDRSHHLTRGKWTRVFGDGKSAGSITEKDILAKIAQMAGLSQKVDASGLSGLSYEYVMQYNQTDWDFLWSRARAFGYQVYVEDRTLYFQKANAVRGTDAPVTLEWGATLASFEPRITLMGQASEAEYHGWDPSKKKEIVGKVSTSSYDFPNQIGYPEKKSETFLKKAFSAAKVVSVDRPAYSQGMAKQMADAELSSGANQFIQADGFLQRGNPHLLAGRKVKIKNVGKNFSGTYYLTKVRHELRGGRYMVQFSVSGSSPHTLYGMLHAGAPTGDRLNSPVVGIVTNVDDPDKLGRVRVKFPWLDPNYESNFARICSIDGGKERGFFFLPEVNDEVLVAFEHGDINLPYIIGRLWNKQDKPPKGTGSSVYAGGKVNQRVICSRTGHRIILDDTDGKEQILIESKDSKASILMSAKDGSITLKSQGDFTIELQGKFIVKSQGDISMETKAGSKITAATKVEVNANQEATIKASAGKLALKPAGTELSGMKVDVKGSTITSISGSAMVEIKGGMVKIN